MLKDVRHPFFIVLEGVDGSGKSTQAELVKEWLETDFKKTGEGEIKTTKEPTDGEIGKILRKHLSRGFLSKESLALLFAADRFENIEKNIKTCMKKGGIVISERYVYSSIVYQSVQGLASKWVCELNRYVYTPDLVIILDLDPKKSIERIEKKFLEGYGEKEIFEKKQKMIEEVCEEYIKISERRGRYRKLSQDYRNIFDTNFEIVDGEGSREKVRRRIKDVVKKFIL